MINIINLNELKTSKISCETSYLYHLIMKNVCKYEYEIKFVLSYLVNLNKNVSLVSKICQSSIQLSDK